MTERSRSSRPDARAQPVVGAVLSPAGHWAQLTSFVGRRRELAEVARLADECRLVTVTGPGGSGKTRLAAEILQRQAAGGEAEALGVELAPVTDADRVVEVMAAAMGVPLGPSRDQAESLAWQVRDRPVLVMLDNCEHLADAVAGLVEVLLRSCPRMRVLATSREPLGASGETVWRVPAMADDEVMALFVERAQAAQPGFALDAGNEAAVRRLCARLDGVPLAVELAAAWAAVLSPAQIDDALDDRFRLLVGGPRHVPDRHRTLLASLEWSHGLLDRDAQMLLRRATVFAGGFDLQAATEVCSDADLPPDHVLLGLRRLVNASMVEIDGRAGVSRYRMTETVREFASALLAGSGDEAAGRDRHLRYFLDRAIEDARDMEHGDQDEVLARLERNHDNFRAALRWSWAAPHHDQGRALTAALTDLWLLHGAAGEGIGNIRRALDASADERTTLQANLWSGLAMLAMPAGRLELIEPAAEQARAIGAEVGDDPRVLARAEIAGCYLSFYSDYERCHDLAIDARHHARAAGAYLTADLARMFEMVSLGNRDRYDLSVPMAGDLYADAMARRSRFAAAICKMQAMNGAAMAADLHTAIELGLEAAVLVQPLRDYFISGTVSSNLAWTLGMAGRLDEARNRIDNLIRSVADAGPDVDVVDLLVVAGKLALWTGDLDAARRWLTRASHFDAPGTDNWTSVRGSTGLATALRHQGRADDAAEAATRGLEMARRLGTPHAEAEALDELGHHAQLNNPGLALDLHHQALAVRLANRLWTHAIDSLDHLARVEAYCGDHLEAARLTGASDAARDRAGYPRPPIDHAADDTLRIGGATAVGAPTWNDALNEGRRLDLEAATTYATRARGPRGRPATGWASLSPTEHEVTMSVVEGLTNPQIAARLLMSRATVKTHLSHIYTKLGIASRAELAAIASRHVAIDC